MPQLLSGQLCSGIHRYKPAQYGTTLCCEGKDRRLGKGFALGHFHERDIGKQWELLSLICPLHSRSTPIGRSLEMYHLLLGRLFISVYNGVWRPTDGPTRDIRIKALLANATGQDKEDLRQEAGTLSKLFHRNIVELFGVVDHEQKVSSANITDRS